MASKIQHRVLDDIAAIGDAVAVSDEESNAQRRLSAALVKQFREIGVMRIVQPGRYGGFEADPRVFNEVMYELSRRSPSAGWVAGVVGVHAWNVGLYQDRTQQEV
jgi:3-hydroxy-9,10-secoandrosta-1,3,5(10)-triene-9,17-dione monooxygenase